MIYSDHNSMDGACGVGVASCFTTYQGYNSEITKGTQGGCGWLTAGFVVDCPVSEEAFDLLANKYNVVFVSEERKNKNSGNMFYFAVFDCSEADVPIGFDQMDGDYTDDGVEDEEDTW